MRKEDCLIWWVSQTDQEVMAAVDRSHWPDELAIEYRSREGRNARGRLWVPTEWMNQPDMRVEWKDGDPMFDALGEDYGGIVLRRDFYHLIANQPGLVTDFDMNIISGNWTKRVRTPYVPRFST